jgi:Mitochondrial carrier protein
MTSCTDSTWSSALTSSACGAARGFVEIVVYPLEVIKIHKQCSPTSEKSMRIAQRLFQEGGYRAFYRGLQPQLARAILKQAWCWPMITEIPPWLHAHYGLGEMSQQVVTGFSIAAVDALVTTPLEKVKIVSALKGKVPLSVAYIYKEGWQGFSTYFAKRSVGMVTFLTAQKFLRDQNRESQEKLSPLELTKIGVEVALIMSVVLAPFDMANTVKQAQNLPSSHFFSRQGVFKLYRGSSINALFFVIHSVASVILIEALKKD